MVTSPSGTFGPSGFQPVNYIRYEVNIIRNAKNNIKMSLCLLFSEPLLYATEFPVLEARVQEALLDA